MVRTNKSFKFLLMKLLLHKLLGILDFWCSMMPSSCPVGAQLVLNLKQYYITQVSTVYLQNRTNTQRKQVQLIWAKLQIRQEGQSWVECEESEKKTQWQCPNSLHCPLLMAPTHSLTLMFFICALLCLSLYCVSGHLHPSVFVSASQHLSHILAVSLLSICCYEKLFVYVSNYFWSSPCPTLLLPYRADNQHSHSLCQQLA